MVSRLQPPEGVPYDLVTTTLALFFTISLVASGLHPGEVQRIVSDIATLMTVYMFHMSRKHSGRCP
jgi:hypothetical protein